MSANSDSRVKRLDGALDRRGEWVWLHRTTGTQKIPVKVKCRATVRYAENKGLIGAVAQDRGEAIISPTQIIAANWPGPETRPIDRAPTTQDRRVPQKSDTIVIQGRPRTVDGAKPIYVDGELVRINIHWTG